MNRVRTYRLEDHLPVPCTVLEWAAAMEVNMGASLVAETLLRGPYPRRLRVSTIFLGVDPWPERPGPPLVFETMTFAENGDCPHAGLQERYATWEEAEAGHARMVERARSEVDHE